MSLADRMSRCSEPASPCFATPKAQLFSLIKYSKVSQSKSSCVRPLNDTWSVPSHTNDTPMSPGPVMASPLSHEPASTLRTRLCSTSTMNVTNVLPEESFAAYQQNLCSSDGDDACAQEDNCFRKPPTPQQCQHFYFIHLKLIKLNC